MAVRQAKSAFGTDTGTEATHGTLPTTPGSYSGNIVAGDVNQNINRQQDDASTFLIRFLIQCDGGSAASNIAPQFEYSKNGGAFTAITTTSSNIKAVTPNAFANAAATTSRLQGTGTFETTSQGCTTDGLAGGAQFDIVANGNGETICGVQLVPADLAAGNTLDLRISGLITVYDFVPRITITAASQVNFSGTPDTASVAATGLAPTFQAHLTVEPTTAALAATGLAPTVSTGLSARLIANAIVAGGANLRDSAANSPPQLFTDIDEVTGSPDALWWEAVNENADIDVRLGFQNQLPDETPLSQINLVGNATIRVLIRGTSLPSRNYKLELWESGTKLTSEVTDTVNSIEGQVVTLQFPASELSAPTAGANIEVRISATAA